MKKKLLAFFLTGVLMTGTFSAFAGCTIKEDPLDPNKTTLYISNYNGGQGTDWIDTENSTDDLIGRFEEAYKDVHFEEGKTGVQCRVAKTSTKGTTLISQMNGMTEEIFFSEDVPYSTASAAGYFLDVSDVIAEIQGYEGVSIDSERLSNIAVDGKYYAIPHYEIFDGINYDIDLFEKENLYFAENKDNGNKGFVLSAADVRSKGPDGQPRTWDDGLPASVDEFFALCDYMITRGIIPMIWSGQYPFYFASLMMAFSANYLSAEELMANFTFDSEGVETEVVTGFNAAGVPQIEKKVITPENGNDVYAQAAKYYALDFMERIYSNSAYYYDKSTASSVFSNTDAQDVFVKSKLKGGKEKPIAMLVDGNWWYNEAKTAIKESYSYGAAAYNRRFGYMPIPTAQTTAQAEAGKEMKLLNRYNSYVFIRATIDPNKISAAKEFLKFCYLPENLQQFTMDTGLHKAVEYTMTKEQLAQLPYETKQIMEYKMKHGSYDARSTSPIYIQNEGEILTASVVNGYGYDYPTDAFKNKVSAKDYFKGMWVGSDTWNAMYSKFFD